MRGVAIIGSSVASIVASVVASVVASIVASVVGAVVVATALGACYQPQLQRCAVLCNASEPCPLDMTCGTDNHCHEPSDTMMCAITHTVTVQQAGTGGGVVAATPGINCPGTCMATVPDGMTMTLMSTAKPGSRFASWGGDCTGMDPGGPCTLVVDKDKTVAANFNLAETLTVEITTNTGMGEVYSIDPPALGFDCQAANQPCVVSWDANASITLMETPNASFLQWGGACATAMTQTCTITLSGPTTVAAMFN